jgi:hypothetical protein
LISSKMGRRKADWAPTRPFSISLLLLLLTLYLGYGVDRSDFVPLLTAWCAFFALYCLAAFRADSTDLNWYLRLGVLLRAVLLCSIPNLSDDVYRFLWDGRLLAAGYHPFAHLPADFMEGGIFPEGLSPELYKRLNSPHYYTVYPPVAQAVFAVAGFLSPGSVLGGVFLIKLFLFACECGSIRILHRQYSAARGPSPALLYALNPLAILEVCGNAHFEGAMIYFLLLGVYALERARPGWAALWWALAVASKLLPLLFLPLVWRRLGLRGGLRWLALFGLFTIALFLPLLQPEILRHIGASLHLYFRQFAFNASVYYALKALIIPWAPPGADVGRALGPVLGLLTALIVVGIAWFWRGIHTDSVRFRQALTLVATVYLLNATTVHPWYVLTPFALSLGLNRRYSLVWTGVVFLSYSHYNAGGFRENYWLIALEYLMLLVAVCWFCVKSISPPPAAK